MILKQKYNRESFLEFQKQFLPDFKKDVRSVSKNGLEVTEDVSLLGQSEQLDLQIFEFTHTSSSNARVSLATDGFKVMKGHGVYQALMAYHSAESDDWRFSLMTATPEISDKGKIRPAFSNPRRYSFFLGPNAKTHTPEQYLIDKGKVESVEDLKNRFSIEVVNKDFYLCIADLFSKLAGGKHEHGRKEEDYKSGLLKLPSSTDETARKEFTVRLIGRLVFCWFLKKKKSENDIPLLSEQLLSSAAVRENKNYYHAILEPLFFEILNTPITERSKSYKEGSWKLTPFLNGGLFSPHDGPHGDFYEPGDMGISKHINTLKVPDQWLEELFEIFETYNFTIDENTSIDVELSIEPEMLGRIFENLLAEINPETGETARKATGSYYTPRPIVDYMVDESLKQYLVTRAKLSESEAVAILSYELEATPVSESQRTAVIDALDSIKIIDPACGSGAFPMGILQKMLFVLQKVDPDSQNWLDKKLASISDVTLRKDLKAKLKADNFNYVHKLGIIRDAIYGVDIQPIAVEISKLRFFLSLIVDEQINDSKENRGIEPLPNLEFKFVCANSLIGLSKVLVQDRYKNGVAATASQRTMFDATSEINELKNLRDDYLRSSGGTKKKIEKKFLEVQGRMAKHALSWALWGGEKSQTMELSQWNPFAGEPCSWFDSDWMFGVKEGFDIVIANPPYGADIDKALTALRPIYQEVIKNYAEIYKMFFKMGLEILKPDGVETFITPNTFLSQPRYKDLRKYLLGFRILKVVNLGEEVFEQCVVPVCVTFMERNSPAQAYSLADVRDKSKFTGNLAQSRFTVIPLTKVASFKDLSLYFGEELGMGQVYFDQALEIKDAGIQYHRSGIGLKNKGGNDLYERLFDSNPKRFKKNQPVWYGKLINKYWKAETTDEFFNLDYRNILKDNESVSFTHDAFNVAPKIIWRQTASTLQATIENDRSWFRNTIQCAYIKPEYAKRLNIYYVLGIINSKYVGFLYNKLVQESGRVFPQVKITHVKKLAMPIPNENIQNDIADIVVKILASKRKMQTANTAALEKKIDLIVYKIYGLTEDEINVVEGSLAKVQ